jgi:exopolysaccharide biosynthesis protein
MTRLTAMLVAGLVLASSGAAWADSEQAAVVIKDGSCTVRDSDGNDVQATEVHKVITSSKNGNVMLRCQAKDIPNATGKAVVWDFNSTGGGRCGVIVGNGNFVFTSDWQQTLSADGRATIVCHVKTQP